MVSGIVSLISLSVFSLLVYRNARDFHIKVFEDCLAQRKQENAIKERPYYGISPTTSFLIWIPFISFSSLIALAKTPKTMLNSSGDNGHPCLVPDFKENAFNFSPLRIMFAVGKHI